VRAESGRELKETLRRFVMPLVAEEEHLYTSPFSVGEIRSQHAKRADKEGEEASDHNGEETEIGAAAQKGSSD